MEKFDYPAFTVTFRRFVQLLPSWFFLLCFSQIFSLGSFPDGHAEQDLVQWSQGGIPTVWLLKKREVVREGGTLKDLFIYFNFLIGIGINRPTS